MIEQTIHERINQRRRQLLVHSFLYYQLNTSEISDHQYDKFCLDLIDLQEKYPKKAEECIFPEEFRGFQMGGSYALPYAHPDVQRWAFRFLEAAESMRKKDKPKEV